MDNNIFDTLEAVGAFEDTKKITFDALDSIMPASDVPAFVLEPEPQRPAPPQPEPEPQEPYNPEEEAEKLLAMLQGGNFLLTTPLYKWKVQKNFGGKQNIQKLRAAYEKHLRGDKLTEKEENDKASYFAYEGERKEWMDSINYTEEELEQLKTLAIPLMKDTKMEISSGAAFWLFFGSIQAGKILKVLE